MTNKQNGHAYITDIKVAKYLLKREIDAIEHCEETITELKNRQENLPDTQNKERKQKRLKCLQHRIDHFEVILKIHQRYQKELEEVVNNLKKF